MPYVIIKPYSLPSSVSRCLASTVACSHILSRVIPEMLMHFVIQPALRSAFVYFLAISRLYLYLYYLLSISRVTSYVLALVASR